MKRRISICSIIPAGISLSQSAMGLGALALGSLLGCGTNKTTNSVTENFFDPINPLAPRPPMFPGKAKSVIYIHMAGAPSQLELFSYKPELAKLDGQDCPPSSLKGKNLHSSERCSKNVEVLN